MKKYKSWVSVILLVFAIFLSFALPKSKYEGTGFISKLKIPLVLSRWQGEDISAKLNVDSAQDTFNFISEVLGYEYTNKEGGKLLFIVLDAGNFHHPKVCFTSAGFDIVELDDTQFETIGRSFKAHTLLIEKGRENMVSFYWIVIDKSVAHEWIEQKFKQLYFSMFNKKRVGLMVRIDIPTNKENVGKSILMAKDFLDDMSKALHQEETDYMFGQN